MITHIIILLDKCLDGNDLYQMLDHKHECIFKIKILEFLLHQKLRQVANAQRECECDQWSESLFN